MRWLIFLRLALIPIAAIGLIAWAFLYDSEHRAPVDARRPSNTSTGVNP